MDLDLEVLRRHAQAVKDQLLAEKAPPGFEGTVKKLKKHKEISNPFALAWWMKNKGYKSRKKGKK